MLRECTKLRSIRKFTPQRKAAIGMMDKLKYDRRQLFVLRGNYCCRATRNDPFCRRIQGGERLHDQLGETHIVPLKQIEAGLLNVGYAEVGPGNGRPVFNYIQGPARCEWSREVA